MEAAPDLAPEEITLVERPWQTMVWDDPVNRMSYVTFVFQKYFGYDKKKAEKQMLEVHQDGSSTVSDGSRRRWSATCRRCTSTAGGPRWRGSGRERLPRHRRNGGLVATFTGFEADLLRSLASQLVELLRNEAAVAGHDADPLEAMLDFSGPTTEPEDPVLARPSPTAYHDDDEAAGEFRRYTETELRNGKAAGAATVIDILEEAGLPPELTEEQLASTSSSTSPPPRPGCGPSPTCGWRWPPGWRSRPATMTTGSRCPTTTPGRRPTTSTTGSGCCRRRSSRR